MNIKTKLVLGFLSIAWLVTVVGIIGIQSARDVTRKFNDSAEHSTPKLIMLGQIKAASLRILEESVSHALVVSQSEHLSPKARLLEMVNEERREKSSNEARREIEKLLTNYKRIEESSEEKERSLELEKMWKATDSLAVELMNL